jgi:menaquinone-dependent protoporphyrinogen oxidase
MRKNWLMANVLVAFASKHHSTAEIAEAVAEELRANGHAVDCVDAGGAAAADGYDAVVLGSAVYIGRWRREARQYLKHNSEALSHIPFWIFSSGPVGEQSDEDAGGEEKWLEPHKVLKQAEAAGVRGHVVFGGRVPQDPGNFVERSMLQNTPEQFRDLRDWDEIRDWAASVARELTG